MYRDSKQRTAIQFRTQQLFLSDSKSAVLERHQVFLRCESKISEHMSSKDLNFLLKSGCVGRRLPLEKRLPERAIDRSYNLRSERGELNDSSSKIQKSAMVNVIKSSTVYRISIKLSPLSNN